MGRCVCVSVSVCAVHATSFFFCNGGHVIEPSVKGMLVNTQLAFSYKIH